MKFEIRTDDLYFTHAGETVRLSAVGPDSIRFQASPSCEIQPLDYTLMPQHVPSAAHILEKSAVLEVGALQAEIFENGKVIYRYHGREILREKPELAFDAGIRNYRNRAGGLWRARVTFEPNEKEHFYGLGHEATGCFDLKGCTME